VVQMQLTSTAIRPQQSPLAHTVYSCVQLAVVLLHLEQTGQVPDWNFWKFLIDHRGNVIGPWGPRISVSELAPVVKKAVEAARDGGGNSANAASRHPNALGEL